MNDFLLQTHTLGEYEFALVHTLNTEVLHMLTAAWLVLGTLLYSLQIQTGSFPKTLSEDEEKYYLELASKGDLEARNILIERNLRLVAHIMKKYYAQTADQEDLISIGTIGLIKGISTFDALDSRSMLRKCSKKQFDDALPGNWSRYLVHPYSWPLYCHFKMSE